MVRPIMRFPSSGRKGRRVCQALRLCVFAGCLATLVSCSQTRKMTVPEETCPCPEDPASDGQALLFHERYAELLTMIENGRFREARSGLETSLSAPEAADVNTTAVFELAAVILLEKKDLTRLKAFKDAFQRYAESLPEGTSRENAERIVRLLEGRIADAYRERKRVKALDQRVEEQGKALEELEYKLQKLEEIQEESEIKREDFQHK
jgi:hypothetical protein